MEDLRGNISSIKLHENIMHKNEIYNEYYVYIYAKFISIKIKIDFKFIVIGKLTFI